MTITLDQGLNGRPGAAPLASPLNTGMRLEYCFSLGSPISQSFVGETQGGYRVDIDYDASGKVMVKNGSALEAAIQSRLLGASLVSGKDWLALSKAGVADVDSRITLAINEAPGIQGSAGFVSARIRGRIDLCTVKQPLASGQTLDPLSVMNQWKAGFGRGSTVSLVLMVVFDVPTLGFNDTETSAYNDCRQLERGIMCAIGTATYGDGPFSPLASIELDMFRLRPAGPGAPGPVSTPIDSEQSAKTEGNS